jgi:hypothetical protein
MCGVRLGFPTGIHGGNRSERAEFRHTALEGLWECGV